MTHRERRERAAALRDEIQSTRERLIGALRSEDYERALSCQMDIEDLEKKTQRLQYTGHRHLKLLRVSEDRASALKPAVERPPLPEVPARHRRSRR